MPLVFSEDEIRRAARARLPDTNIVRVSARQTVAELTLKLKGLDFRFGANDKAVAAYERMTLEEFDGINARQRWANWRTIPRNLSGRIQDQPLIALDLCCGVGQSTEVLAHYLPRGSRILGLEYQASFVARARTRKYLDARGQGVNVEFRAQSVLEPFCGVDGTRLGDQSQDLVNCMGAVGSHFDPQASELLLREIARVMKPGGLAMLDCGAKGTDLHTLSAIAERFGFERKAVTRSTFLDIYPQVCFERTKGTHHG